MQETNNLLSSIPQDLYMRLSHRSLSFARHELRREPYFDYSIFNIQHRSSLRSNLQEALATLPILQSPFLSSIDKRVHLIQKNIKKDLNFRSS